MNIASLLPGSRLVQFVFDETDRPLGRVLMFGVISGIAGALVLAAINHGAQAVGARLIFSLYYCSRACLGFFCTRNATL